MPSLLPRSPLVPDCVACCRSLARLGLSAPAAGTLQQTRGKKKNAKPVTQITVRLVKDLPGYGRKGTRRQEVSIGLRSLRPNDRLLSPHANGCYAQCTLSGKNSRLHRNVSQERTQEEWYCGAAGFLVRRCQYITRGRNHRDGPYHNHTTWIRNKRQGSSTD